MLNKKILLIFIVFFNTVQAQTIQTYSGRFQQGSATYSYYENDNFERIYHGNFKYKVNLSQYAGSATGKFSHNEKKGAWIYVYDKKKLGNYIDRYSTTYNFKNRLVQGLVSINHATLKNNKIIKSKTYKFNVSNGFIIGKFSIGNLIGEFDNNGQHSGRWHYTHKLFDLEYIANFKKGILINFVKRRLSDGEIIDRYNMNQNDLSIIDSMDGKELREYPALNIKHSKSELIDPARKLYDFQKIINTELGVLLEIGAVCPIGSLGFFMNAYMVSANGFHLSY